MKNGVVATLLVVAILAGAGVGYYVGYAGQSAVTSHAKTTGSAVLPGPYTLTFRQREVCSPSFWMLPWSVTLDGATEKVQPPNASIPPAYYYSTSNATLSTIVFFVGNGTYQWKSFPSSGYGDPSSGNVTIAGSDTVIQVDGFPTSCTTTSTATS